MPPKGKDRGKWVSPPRQGNEDDATSVPTQRRHKATRDRGLQKKENRSAKNGENSLKGMKSKSGGASVLQAMEGKGVENRAKSVGQLSHHIAHCLRNLSQGSRPCAWQNIALNAHVVNKAKELTVHKEWNYFDRRVTALAWHPQNHTTVISGTKSGDIFVWNFEQTLEPTEATHGTGANGSIQALVFDKTNPDKMITASINGTVTRHTDFRNKEIVMATGDCQHWYTSLDMSAERRALLVGDNKGWVTLLTPNDQVTWRQRLHCSKVTHIEFSPRDSHYLVTASVDRTLKVWDIRNIKCAKSYLYSDCHEKPVNSAYFSCTDGNRILTTDQCRELRIYSFPSLILTRKILHPHRHFQHLTPIKATWHPLRDLIVVGRYPDLNFPGCEEGELRTIDFFDGVTGHLMHQHFKRPTGNKIIPLNSFSPCGDYLLSAGGIAMWVWKHLHCEEDEATIH